MRAGVPEQVVVELPPGEAFDSESSVPEVFEELPVPEGAQVSHEGT